MAPRTQTQTTSRGSFVKGKRMASCEWSIQCHVTHIQCHVTHIQCHVTHIQCHVTYTHLPLPPTTTTDLLVARRVEST